MKRYRAELELKIVGPFLSKSLDTAALGTDASCRRRSDFWVLPGTQLRGHLRESLALIAQRVPAENLDALILAWFGKGTDEHTKYEPARGALTFAHEFLSVETGGKTVYRVAIDEKSGVAADAALLVLESAGKPGETLTFKGHIDGYFVDNSRAKTCHRWLTKALAWIDAMGAFKGIGFGELKCAMLGEFAACTETIAKPNTTTASHKTLRFQLDRPFCFSEREVRGNTFTSKPFVPGAAVLGALFRYCNANPDNDCKVIMQCSENIGCTHALPLKPNKSLRPISMAQLSVVTLDEKGAITAHDVRACNTPTFIEELVPRFQPDWKDRQFDAVFAALDLPAKLDRELIVRTAITDGRAADENLFALECLNPGNHTFDCTISVSGNAGTTALWAALAAVLPQALCGLGQTDAIATSLALTAPTVNPAHVTFDLNAGLIFVTLQSDAAINIDVTQLNSTGDGAALHALYRARFATKSNNSLTLSHFFARQRYVGGNYLHKRFGSTEYQATLLTEAGSVFAFKVDAAETAQTVLKEWAKFGLPCGENTWKTNPYRRENGYGEVTIDAGPAGKVRALPIGGAR